MVSDVIPSPCMMALTLPRPKMYGTPPRYGEHSAMPGVGSLRRKRSGNGDAEDAEIKASAKRTQANAAYVPILEAGGAGGANLRHIPAGATIAASSKSMLSFFCIEKQC